MIAIDKKIDWSAIRAEYIGGGISQRKLAQKYDIKPSLLMSRANREKWADERNLILSKTKAKVEQKIADKKAQNAATLERIRGKLLKRLEREIDSLPDSEIGTEKHSKIVQYTDSGKKESTKVIRIKELISAYKELLDEDFRREKLDLEKAKQENDW